MNIAVDAQMAWMLSGVVGLLIIASIIGFLLGRNITDDAKRVVIDNLKARTWAWWVMCAIFAAAIFSGTIGAVILFALMSFLALREFITLTPTNHGDHRTLFWVFFVVVPLHYYLVAIRWYGLFSILIPVYVFLFVPLRSALAGETANFLERTSKIQWGLMACVYCVSHAPALLMLDIPGYSGNAKLLFFLVLVAQLSDVLQYVFGKTLGRRKIVPLVSPNKTWEGFLGGVICSSLIGAGLWWATPFTPLQAGGMALAINLMGFSGGLCMSAIKRDRGVKDFGTMIEGHGGIMDRIDSISFAAPIFFHLTRFYFT